MLSRFIAVYLPGEWLWFREDWKAYAWSNGKATERPDKKIRRDLQEDALAFLTDTGHCPLHLRSEWHGPGENRPALPGGAAEDLSERIWMTKTPLTVVGWMPRERQEVRGCQSGIYCVWCKRCKHLHAVNNCSRCARCSVPRADHHQRPQYPQGVGNGLRKDAVHSRGRLYHHGGQVRQRLDYCSNFFEKSWFLRITEV